LAIRQKDAGFYTRPLAKVPLARGRERGKGQREKENSIPFPLTPYPFPTSARSL